MRDMIDSPYLYSQLPSHGYIRQLHLASGRDDEPLVCSLHAVLVDEAPAFETISYTWGVPIKSHSILCEGKAIPITANLSHALHQVRLPDKPRILWADSICINQGNLEEQAHQVAFMGEVYTKAWRTLICLDDSAGDLQHSAIAAVLIRDVNEMVARVQSQQDFTWKSDCYPTTDQDDPVISDSRWPSLGVLLQQKWFTRCWVVQEVALSKEARILWAGQNIEWRDLLRVYYWINYRAPRILDVPGVFLSKLHARMFEVYWEKEAITFSSELQFKSPSFLKILDWERALKVSDPRDRIYAFLGLPACRGLALQLSYKRPYLQIYQEFAEEYIKKISDLDILHAAHHNETSIRDPIPSWVPRWDILVYHIDCFHLSWEKITPRENTSPICVSLEDGLLEVRGVEIGQLVFASQRFDTTTSTMQDVSSLWSEVSSFTEDCYTYPRIRAFIRTLRLGLYGGGWHEWTSHEDFYERYLQNQTPLQDQEASDPLVPSTLFRYAHNRKLVLIDKGVYGLAPGIVAKGDVCSIIYGTRTAFALRPTTQKDVFTLLGAIFILSPNLKDNNQSQRLQMADWREWGREKTIRIA